jgi:membrane protein
VKRNIDGAIGDDGRWVMPWHVAGRRDWLEMVLQTARDLRRANVLEWAATLAFYALLSLFPLLLALMIAASYFVDPAWATGQAVELLGEFLPKGEFEIEEIVNGAIDSRRRTGIISVVVLLVTGRRILGALTKALNLVSDVDEQRDSIKRRIAVELSMVVGLIGALLLGFAARPLVAFTWETLELIPGPDGRLLDIVQVAVRAALLMVTFTLVYAVVPRGERYWRAAAAGALVATSLFLAAQVGFTLVIDILWSNLTPIYGPLALGALLLSWAWYIALITLIGGSLASHIKVMVLERRPAADASRAHVG